MICNLLIDPLPEAVIIDGTKHPINTSFRAGILFELLITEDHELSPAEKIAVGLGIWYPEMTFGDLQAAWNAAVDFYCCGKTLPQRRLAAAQKGFDARAYSYELDAEYICAAFQSEYGIDLTDAEMHWWRFRALFRGLGSDNELVKIMGYRSANLSEIKSKEERARITRLKNIYALPSALSDEEKAARAGALFAGGIM